LSAARAARRDSLISQDFLPALRLVVEALERLGVPYYIGGSVASSVHGVPRSTNDVDVVADLQLRHVTPLVHALGDAFYIDEDAVRDAVERRSSFNVVYLTSMFKIDVFAAAPTPFARNEMARRQQDTLGEEPGAREFSVASPEDTILRKLEWYRAGSHISNRQWQDVQEVIQTRDVSLDVPYLRRWAPALGVADLLERALTEAGRAD
jgi:hypothetical protein